MKPALLFPRNSIRTRLYMRRLFPPQATPFRLKRELGTHSWMRTRMELGPREMDRRHRTQRYVGMGVAEMLRNCP
jgi:hypothetical protein